MATSHSFSDLAQVVIAAYSGRDPSFPKRLQFWIVHFAQRNVNELTTDDIEDGVDALIRRDKRRAHTTRNPIKPSTGISTIVPTGDSLSPATVNRCSATLGTMFKDLRRMRLLPRGFVNPIRGVQRQPEGPGRTLNVTVDDVMRLIDACRVSRNRKLAGLDALSLRIGLIRLRANFHYPWVLVLSANCILCNHQTYSTNLLCSLPRLLTRLSSVTIDCGMHRMLLKRGQDFFQLHFRSP